MYLVGFSCVLCFLLAQRMDHFVAFMIFATLSAFFAGALTWYFSDEREKD